MRALRKLRWGVAASQRRAGARYRAAVGRDMPNYWAQLDENYAVWSNAFDYYRELVLRVAELSRTRLVPVCDLLESDADGRPRIALRHDIDADPLTGLRAARLLAREGLPGSFYLLHTAPYYGDFHDGLFVRNPQLAEWVRGFIVAGCELGLHNDALGALCHHGVDGIGALMGELAWLRMIGAQVRGTVAHNSGPIYGAENSEIFKGRVLWPRRAHDPGGRRLPLGSVSEAQLGLSYEGSFAVPKKELDPGAARAFLRDHASVDPRSEKWMRSYLLANPCNEWAVDLQCWLVGRDAWVVAGRPTGEPLFELGSSLIRVLDVLRDLPDRTRALLVIHPAYVRGTVD